MIRFDHISKSFGTHQVLNDITTVIREGVITYIIGASGTGKSVFVKHIVGHLYPDRGKVLVDGVDVTTASEKTLYKVRKDCVLVFQLSTLFDSMTLAENVALPLRVHRRMRKQAALKEAMKYLEMVQMQDKADLMPQEVGPSEQKRVSIARALTLEPKYAILDEPTTGLDVIAAANVDDMIRHLKHNLGVTVLVVSHDLRSIMTVAERIIFLYKGNIYMDGTPMDFKRSDDPIVRQFLGGLPQGPMET